MELDYPDNLGKIVLLISIVFMGTIFSYSFLRYITPKKEVWRGKLFDVWYSFGKTRIRGQKENSISFNGIYDLNINETYEITYISQYEKRNIINITKVDN